MNRELIQKYQEEYPTWRPIDEKDISLRYVPGWGQCICYKEVPLWLSINLDVAIFLAISEETEEEPICLVCIDKEFEDIYTYGNWDTLEEAEEWLKNPKMLY
jgi:hypothetical protein